jgi:hypothetical protein
MAIQMAMNEWKDETTDKHRLWYAESSSQAGSLTMANSRLWKIAVYFFAMQHSFKDNPISFHFKAHSIRPKPRFVIGLIAFHLFDLPALAQRVQVGHFLKDKFLYRFSDFCREPG